MLLVRRGEEAAVLPGLWELPTLEAATPSPAEFAARFGGRWSFAAEPAAALRHAITFRRIELEVWPADWQPEGVAESGAADLRWTSAAEASRLALTGATRKLLARL
jgi:adenine-specific DNA glycosylase